MLRPSAVLGVLTVAIAALVSSVAAQQQRPAQPPGGGGVSSQACGEGCGGGDTQPPIISLLAPLGEVYTSTITVTVDWCDDQSLSSTSRWVKMNGNTLTTDYVNSTPLQDCGVRKKSTATNVSVNVGQNTLQAHICDNSSNCTTTTFYITRRAGPVPIVSLAPYSANLQDFGRCAAACFAATYAQSTVSYVSLDAPRTVTLVYNGARVDPKPFVHVDVTHGGDASNLPSYFYLKVQKSGGGYLTFLNGESSLHFAPSAGVALRLGGQFSAAANGLGPDSVYSITVIVGASYSGGVEETSYATRLIVVNENGSPIARGWTIAGIQRVYVQSDGSVLITESDGSATYFLKSGSAFVTPTGDFTALSVSGSGSGTSYTRRYQDSSRVVFDYQGRMTAQVNRWGDTTSVSYDGSGRPSSITDPAHLSYALSYGSYGLQSITDPYSRVTGVTVQSNRTLTALTDPDNVATTFTYDDSLRLWKVTDRNGVTASELTYHNTSGTISTSKGPWVDIYGGSSVRPTAAFAPWQLLGVPYASTSGTAATPPRADTVRGTVTDPSGHASRFTVNALGQPLVTTDPLGNAVTVTYTASGLVSSVVDQLGVSSSFWYDATGFITQSAVAGVYSYARKDQVWNFPDSTWGDAQVGQRIFYGQHGRVDSVRVAGHRTLNFFDAHGRITQRYDLAGHYLGLFSYAGINGNRSRDSLPGGRVTLYRYDQYGRQDSVQTTGRPWRVTVFDVLNRPTHVYDGVNANPTVLAYDSLRLRTVTDPMSQQYQYRYNALGWQTSRLDPVSRADSFEYDADGLLRRSINRRGQADSVAYDALHRVRAHRGGANGPDSTAYSSDARVITITNAASSEAVYLNATTRASDSVITQLTIPGVGTRTFVRRFAYRANGQLDSAYTTGPSGSSFLNQRYGYNTTWRSVDSLRFGSGWTIINRNNDGQQVSVRFPTTGDSIYNGVLPEHNLPALRSSLVGGLADFYHFNENGELDQVNRQGTDVRLFAYDSLGRLASAALANRIDSVCVPAGDQGFSCSVPYDSIRANTYDAVGNRTAVAAQTWGGQGLWSTTGSYGTGNRITSFWGCGYGTDYDGNVTSRTCPGDTLNLAWSSDGRLTSLTRNGVTTSYTYDAAGRLIRRDSAGTTVSNFVWDGDNLLAELVRTGDTTRSQYSYYPGLDNLHAFAFRSGGLTYTGYAHRDQLGNMRGLADGVYYYRRYTFDEWGQVTNLDTGSPSPGELDRARWKGALYMAPEAGLYYMRDRWYEPHSGRFLSEDPVGLASGLNPYVFVASEPVLGSDPTGDNGGIPIGGITVVAPPYDGGYVTPEVIINPNCESADRAGSLSASCRAQQDDQRNYLTSDANATGTECVVAKINLATTVLLDAATLATFGEAALVRLQARAFFLGAGRAGLALVERRVAVRAALSRRALARAIAVEGSERGVLPAVLTAGNQEMATSVAQGGNSNSVMHNIGNILQDMVPIWATKRAIDQMQAACHGQ